MIVQDWMTKGSINIGMDSSVLDAADIIRRQTIRQLPVIDEGGRLAGIVSDRDVRDAMPSKFLASDSLSGDGLMGLKVKTIMTEDPLTIPPDATMEMAADLLMLNKIGGLPVVSPGNILLGIVTESDVFRFLCSVTGVSRQGIQLVFLLSDDPGSVIELLSHLGDQDIRLTSVLTSYENVKPGKRKVSIRVQSAGKHTVDSLIELLRGSYELLYYVHDGKAVAL